MKFDLYYNVNFNSLYNKELGNDFHSFYGIEWKHESDFFNYHNLTQCHFEYLVMNIVKKCWYKWCCCLNIHRNNGNFFHVIYTINIVKIYSKKFIRYYDWWDTPLKKGAAYSYLPTYIIPLLLKKKLRHRTAREPKPSCPPNININLFDSTTGLRHLLHVYGSLCCHYLLTESSESEQKILGTSVGPCLEGDPANAIKSSEVKTRQDMTRDNSQ